MKTILIINGPNLNLLGSREPEIYGTKIYTDLVNEITAHARALSFDTVWLQSNSEGEIVDFIQKHASKADAIVINAAAYTHYSHAIGDALVFASKPAIEVHISNIGAREEFRHHSVLARACIGQISGFGFDSYKLALDQLARLLAL